MDTPPLLELVVGFQSQNHALNFSKHFEITVLFLEMSDYGGCYLLKTRLANSLSRFLREGAHCTLTTRTELEAHNFRLSLFTAALWCYRLWGLHTGAVDVGSRLE